MKRFIHPLLLSLSLFGLYSCSNDSITDDMEKAKKTEDSSLKTSATATITGLTRFKMANLAIPSGGLYDGRRFYTNGILRANTAYYPYSVAKENKGGVDRLRFYVKPTDPASYLAGKPYPYHFRAEICRYPWLINLPLGTEEWIGFSYIFPTKEEGFTQNQTPVSIFQNHDGKSRYPSVQLEIAYPKQLYSPYADRTWYNTPLGGEIMIVNHVRGIRWVAKDVRVQAGARINIIIQIVYGTGNNGLFNVWINGKLQTWPGYGSIPAGNVGSTVWPTNPKGGNSKLGMYHHGFTNKTGVDKNLAKGHSHMRFWMTEWNDVIRKPGDWDYKNTNAYSAVNTMYYP